MVANSLPETLEQKVARLEAELQSERARADNAEQQLQRVNEAFRAVEAKQVDVAQTRTGRDAQLVEGQRAETLAEAIGTSSGVAEAWDDRDPTLDDRLDRYLESSFEPDSSRDWMLNG